MLATGEGAPPASWACTSGSHLIAPCMAAKTYKIGTICQENSHVMSRDLPPLNALRAFEAVARLDSVSRAADELHVTHGAVSRHLRALEETLGTALFVRQGRGLALTPAGRRLHEAADAAFEPLRGAWAELRRRPLQAPLVLGCPGSVLARWMIPRLERLERELPDLKLHLSASETDSRCAAERSRRRTADLAGAVARRTGRCMSWRPKGSGRC